MSTEYLAVGRSVFTPSGLKIHHWAGSVEVTEMANAGKRGKKVQSFTFSTANYGQSDTPEAEKLYGIAIAEIATLGYQAALRHIRAHTPDIFRVSEGSPQRGIDVQPPSTEIRWDRKFPNGTELRVTASPYDFRIINSPLIGGAKRAGMEGARQDTLYYARGKTSAGKFYAWLRGNLSKAERMGWGELQDVLRTLGAEYDYQ
jgi:hypothetical protein